MKMNSPKSTKIQKKKLIWMLLHLFLMIQVLHPEANLQRVQKIFC